MDLAHDVRAREVQHLGAVLLVPVVVQGKVHGLHAAAHRAVAEQHLLGKPVQETTHERPPANSMGFSMGRSEEHTSELQSLMRISYAVFCLKKKISITHTAKKF